MKGEPENILVRVDPRYFRPTEVELLLVSRRSEPIQLEKFMPASLLDVRACRDRFCVRGEKLACCLCPGKYGMGRDGMGTSLFSESGRRAANKNKLLFQTSNVCVCQRVLALRHWTISV